MTFAAAWKLSGKVEILWQATQMKLKFGGGGEELA